MPEVTLAVLLSGTRPVVGLIGWPRRSRHLMGVWIADQLQAADAAAVNDARPWRVIAGRRELLTDRRAACRALPGHRDLCQCCTYTEAQPYASQSITDEIKANLQERMGCGRSGGRPVFEHRPTPDSLASACTPRRVARNFTLSAARLFRCDSTEEGHHARRLVSRIAQASRRRLATARWTTQPVRRSGH